MDKTIAGLLGAVGALVAAAPAEATPLQPTLDAVLHASGYSELLRPMPNSLAILRAMDEAASKDPVVRVEDRDHHHHHRAERRPPPRRDHHHHHHNSDRSVFR